MMHTGASSEDAQSGMEGGEQTEIKPHLHIQAQLKGDGCGCQWAEGRGSGSAHSWQARLGSGVKGCQQGGSPDTCLVSCLTLCDSATASDANCCHTWSKGLNVSHVRERERESGEDGRVKVRALGSVRKTKQKLNERERQR